MSIMRVAALICGLALFAGTAGAQITSTPRHIGESRYTYEGDRSPVEILTQHQKSGDWDRLQRYAQELLADFGKQPNIAALLGNVEKNYYYFVWQSEGSDGKPVINRALVHRNLEPQRAARLPGIDSSWPQSTGAELKTPEPAAPPREQPVNDGGAELFDVLLTDATRASLTSVYVFTPTPDPIQTQLPDVVSKLNILGFLAKTEGAAGDESSSLLVYVNQPNLLMSRAKVQIKDVIATRILAASLIKDAEKTFQAVMTHQARSSPCAQKLAEALRSGITEVATTAACNEGNATCATALKQKIDSTYQSLADPKSPNACTAEPAMGFGFDPVVATEQEFRKLVISGGARTVTGEASAVNQPLTRLSYGLMTGLLIGNTTLKEARVKVDAGKIVNAPLDRALTMVVLNIHPWAYDSEWPRVSWAERLRAFAGGVITPDFGLTAGVGLGLVRGLTVNGGAVWLFMETPKANERVGEAPQDTNDPFRSRVGLGGFVGFSYTFK